MNFQIVGTVVSLFVSVATLVVILVGWGWWTGKMDEALKTIKATISELKQIIEKMRERDEIFLRREDFLIQVANRNKEIADIWKAQNELRDRFNDCRANNAKCGQRGE